MNNNKFFNLDIVIEEINRLLTDRDFIIIGVDGPCLSGKTTFSEELREKIDCTVVHLDSFFLRKEQRTPERLMEVGGNLDRERLINELLFPLKGNGNGNDIYYREYSCKKGDFDRTLKCSKNKVYIFEGSYAFQDELFPFYDMSIFIKTTKNEQIKRLKIREKEKVFDYLNKWIPLEEKYFNAIDGEQLCSLVIET